MIVGSDFSVNTTRSVRVDWQLMKKCGVCAIDVVIAITKIL
jgi:hypothetical protein